MEQALADVMYDATGAIEVYSMQIEELCDNMEIYQFIKGKDIKNSERTYPSISLNQDLTIKLNKQPHFRKLQQLYNEYMNELTEWMNVDVKRDGFGYFEDLLGIFNPDELNVEKDNAIAKRIEEYKLNLKHI